MSSFSYESEAEDLTSRPNIINKAESDSHRPKDFYLVSRNALENEFNTLVYKDDSERNWPLFDLFWKLLGLDYEDGGEED